MSIFIKKKITKGIEEGLLRRNLLYYGKYKPTCFTTASKMPPPRRGQERIPKCIAHQARGLSKRVWLYRLPRCILLKP
jgi:hypothetical protein